MIIMFSQGNSGGYYTYPAKYIIVNVPFGDDRLEMGDDDWYTDESIEDAIESVIDTATKAAETVGLYLDGVAKGYDCRCCGDRWGSYNSDFIFESIEDAIKYADRLNFDSSGAVPNYVVVNA